jgi:O-antigen/teichoic acid export membrane protein
MLSTRKSKLLQGSASNLVRMLLSMMVSLLLPPFLVHRMAPTEYSAWVLILQLSAYVTFLDFGVQTAIGKFVAEYDAVGDRNAARQMVSSAFSLLSIASMIGCIVVLVLTYKVPQLFHQMPPFLFHEVRVGLLCIGLSVCFMLPFSVFMTTFTGLQEYGFPTVFISASRILSALCLAAVVFLHGSILQMAWMMAAFNLATAFAQVIGWKQYASDRVPFTLFYFDRQCLRRLFEYCGVLSIWTMGGLLISGLDTAIVGHFDYANTGYYAVAGSATNFMLLLSGNMLSPLLPAISSLQTQRTPEQIGDLLVRATRIGVTTLMVFGLPLLLGGYPLLTLWLGSAYAAKSVLFLEILVVGNIFRQFSFPYALFIVATGKQRYATVAPVAESIVNVILSVLLARRYGAIGVAVGTLLASFVGLAAHALISMQYTQSTIAVRRLHLLLQGILRPACCLLPTLLILPFWHRYSLWPVNPGLLLLWVLSTGSLVWWVSLAISERTQIQQQVHMRFGKLLYKGARA